MKCYGIGTITRSFNSHLHWCQGSSSVDRYRPLIITDYILCFRSFWRNIPALWSFICCSTSGFPSSMHLNMTSLPANTGLYSKSVTVEKLVRKVWVFGTTITRLCSSQSRLHVSLFPLREEAAGDVVRASLLSRNNAVTQHLQGGTHCSCSASGLSLFTSPEHKLLCRCRTVATTGASQPGWPITSTTRCTHHPVSANTRTHTNTCHGWTVHLTSRWMCPVAVYGEQQIRLGLIAFLVYIFQLPWYY